MKNNLTGLLFLIMWLMGCQLTEQAASPSNPVDTTTPTGHTYRLYQVQFCIVGNLPVDTVRTPYSISYKDVTIQDTAKSCGKTCSQYCGERWDMPLNAVPVLRDSLTDKVANTWMVRIEGKWSRYDGITSVHTYAKRAK